MSPAYPTPLLYLLLPAHLYNVGWNLSESVIICDYTIILAIASLGSKESDAIRFARRYAPSNRLPYFSQLRFLVVLLR